MDASNQGVTGTIVYFYFVRKQAWDIHSQRVNLVVSEDPVDDTVFCQLFYFMLHVVFLETKWLGIVDHKLFVNT